MERRAEKIDVGARLELRQIADDHLGRHVRRRSDRAASRADGLRDARGDAPVDDVDLAEAPDHHVVELEISMHDAAAVREMHRVADGREDLEVRVETRGARWLRRSRRLKLRRTFDQCGVQQDLLTRVRHETPSMRFHDEHGSEIVIVATERVHRDDVRVLEVPGDDALVKERLARVLALHVGLASRPSTATSRASERCTWRRARAPSRPRRGRRAPQRSAEEREGGEPSSSIVMWGSDRRSRRDLAPAATAARSDLRPRMARERVRSFRLLAATT